MKEQNTLLDSFVVITSTAKDLEPQSFLSTVDMDPGPSTPGPGITPGGSVFTTATGVYMGGPGGIYVGSPSSGKSVPVS